MTIATTPQMHFICHASEALWQLPSYWSRFLCGMKSAPTDELTRSCTEWLLIWTLIWSLQMSELLFSAVRFLKRVSYGMLVHKYLFTSFWIFEWSGFLEHLLCEWRNKDLLNKTCIKYSHCNPHYQTMSSIQSLVCDLYDLNQPVFIML